MKIILKSSRDFFLSLLRKGERYILNTKSKKLKKLRSLSGTLVFTIVALSLSSLFLASVIGIYVIFKSEQRNIFTKQQLVAQNSAGKVYDYIHAKTRSLDVITRLINPSIISEKELNFNLNHLLGHIPDFRHLIVFNYKKEKAAMVSRFSQLKMKEVEERFTGEMFEKTIKKRTYISQVYIDKFTSEPMIILAVPVIDSFKDYQGVLAAELNLKFLWDLMESLKIGSSNNFYVVDKMGKLIAYTDISRVIREDNLVKIDIVEGFVRDSAYYKISDPYIYRGINNKAVIGTYVSLGMPDWAVITEVPISEAYGTVIRNIIIAAVFIIIIGAVAGIAGIHMARSLAMPIEKLTDVAIQISGGKTNLKAELNGPSEIKKLESAFNGMVNNLLKIINGFEKKNEYNQNMITKYMEHLNEIGRGNPDSNLELNLHSIEIFDPLILLGKQINTTVEKLKRFMDESRQATNKLIQQEKKLQDISTKLLRSNNELEQFIFIISQDMQGPLKEISSFSDGLITNYSNLLDEKALENVKKINNASIGMDNFIKNLLRFSRITTKTRIIKPIDLNLIVKEAVDDLEDLINETNTELSIDHLPVLDADAFQIKQLFFNIIENAIKYRRDGVTPVVKVKLLADKKDDYYFCEINIIDNGIGFSNAYAEKLFGLYQRPQGRNKYKGAGLGLAACKKIIEQHNGLIKVFGKEGAGSTIYIKLPVKQVNIDRENILQ